MIRVTMTTEETNAMVTAMVSTEVELGAEEMQVALAEYEYHEENWETLESDDSHIDLYQNEI
tara:strand:- start:346 stop:531 length:186 start_codon:yes stop_codon:yes gene_type:complete